jgi:hypothetical protein
MEKILRRGMRAIDKTGYVRAAIRFVLEGTLQKGLGCEAVDIWVNEDRLSLGYHIGHPHPHEDFDKRKEFFRRILKVGRFPLKISRGVNEDGLRLAFSFKHTGKGVVRVQSSDGAPLTIYCEMPSTKLDELVERVSAILEEFASTKPFTVDWSIRGDADSMTWPVGKRIYAAAREFPGKKVWINLVAHLGRIEGAEQLGSLCAGSSHFIWNLCGFTLPSERVKRGNIGGKLWVQTNHEGHRLSLEMKPVDPPLLPEIKKKLKVEFRVLA